tara:strand:- start:1 stop:306 length:306 start_codon:yes stop_codon:yes gene_type:complete
MMIVTNQVEYLKCGDKPYSAHGHDMRWCGCGNIAVDGGQDYLKRAGNLDGYKEMSIEALIPLVQALEAQIGVSLDTGRNDYGVALGVFRAIRDAGYKIVEV